MAERTKNIVIAVCVLILSLALSTAVVQDIKANAYRQEQERISYITETQASKLQSAINSLFQKTQTLKMLVIQGNGVIDNFEQVAAELADDSSIRSLQLAPNGVVTQVYPLLGNEEAFGDLFSDPDRAKEAIWARDTGKLTMSGPFMLNQGGFGIVGRQPVYMTGADGKPAFWGFTIIVLDLPSALYPADLDRLVQEGYDYKLHRIHPDTNKVQVFAESTDAPLKEPVNVSFDVPNAQWTISVTPRHGWITYSDLISTIAVSICISILVSLLAYMVLSLNAQRVFMRRLSVTDTLTGLYNRRKFHDIMVERCAFVSNPFTICYIDLNEFKSVNDNFSHDVGDHFLMACARSLEQCLKMDEMLFRVGGDEFIVILNYEDEADHKQKCIDRLSHALCKSFLVDGFSIAGSASFGCASFPEDGNNLEQLVNTADASMYRHKAEYKKKNLH